MLWYSVVPGASVMKRALHSETPSLSIRARAPKLTLQQWTGGARLFVCRTQHTLVQALIWKVVSEIQRSCRRNWGHTYYTIYIYICRSGNLMTHRRAFVDLVHRSPKLLSIALQNSDSLVQGTISSWQCQEETRRKKITILLSYIRESRPCYRKV